jgi:hypothetical protein
MTFGFKSSAPRRLSACLGVGGRRLIGACPMGMRHLTSPGRRLCGARRRARDCRFDDSGLEIIGLVTSIEPILNALVSAEIGAVAPLSDTHGMSGGSGMAPSSRDRLSVDLHGLKAALFERARLARRLALGLVSTTLAEALGGPAGPVDRHTSRAARSSRCGDACGSRLRMSRDDASAVLAALVCRPEARATTSPTWWPGSLRCAGQRPNRNRRRADRVERRAVHVQPQPPPPDRCCARVSSGPAEEYRPMLDTLGADVREPPGSLVTRAGRPAAARGSACSSGRSAQPTDQEHGHEPRSEHRRRPDHLGRPALLSGQPDRHTRSRSPS